MKKLLIALVFAALLSVSSASRSGIIGNIYTGLASEATQLLNFAELLYQSIQLYEQLLNMEFNTEMFAGTPIGGTSDMQDQIWEIIERGQAIAYTLENADELFDERYQGYEAYAENEIEDWTLEYYRDLYRNWSVTNRDMIKNNLRSLNYHYDRTVEARGVTSAIEDLMLSAEGRNQLVKVGNTVKYEQMKQLDQLIELTLQQSSVQHQFLIREAEKEDVEQAMNDALNPERDEMIHFDAPRYFDAM